MRFHFCLFQFQHIFFQLSVGCPGKEKKRPCKYLMWQTCEMLYLFRRIFPLSLIKSCGVDLLIKMFSPIDMSLCSTHRSISLSLCFSDYFLSRCCLSTNQTLSLSLSITMPIHRVNRRRCDNRVFYFGNNLFIGLIWFEIRNRHGRQPEINGNEAQRVR